MPQLKNSEQSFGWPAKTFHWLMAILIIGMLCLGLYMKGLPVSPDKFKLYGLHKSTGILILFLVSLRFGWREVNFQPSIPQENGRKFIYPPNIYKFMEIFAKFWHLAIYFMMFLMPVTGLLMSSAYGFSVSFFGLFVMPNLVAPNKELADNLRNIHDFTSYILIGFLIVHILAGLFHHYIMRDIVMKRMLPAIVLLLISTSSFAADAPKPTVYKVNKDKSSISFEANVNSASGFSRI